MLSCNLLWIKYGTSVYAFILVCTWCIAQVYVFQLTNSVVETLITASWCYPWAPAWCKAADKCISHQSFIFNCFKVSVSHI